ncbi:MAG TPA: DUF2207 domain-containing protein [Patescibacteria group bacterium]|nr:DUF2207 domain-containing protein [Patescibacteria group bacterium]
MRTFRFKGTFSFAFIEWELSGDYGRYTIEYWGVWDADSGEKLRSEVTSDPGSVRLTWYYTASHETRRFAIRYRIGNAVQRFGEVAQFYWKGIEERHASLGQVRIRIIPPTPSPRLFKVFVHGDAPPGILDIAGDFGEATVDQSSIPRRSFVELRVLLDPALFPLATVRTDQTYETILANEKRIAERTLRTARRKRAVVTGAIVIVMILIGTYAWLFARFGREPHISYDHSYEREPPRDLPPSVLPAIMTQSAAQISEMPKAFAATLLECARLGYLSIHETEGDGLLGTGFMKKTGFTYRATQKGEALLLDKPVVRAAGERELTAFEIDVFKVVFNGAGAGTTATSGQIEEWGKKMKGRKSAFLLFAEPRAKLLRERFEKEYFPLDDRGSEKVKGWFRASSIAVGVCLMVLFFTALRTPVVIGLGAFVILFGALASVPLARRTPQAALEHERWQAFKKFMTDFSAMKEAGPSLLPLWERYLVYATALGVAEKLLSNLKLVARESNMVVPVVVWYHPLSTSGSGTAHDLGFASLESLSASFSNIQSLSSALSTSTGSGGGFSGGGGGGGGGGCSGAG